MKAQWIVSSVLLAAALASKSSSAPDAAQGARAPLELRLPMYPSGKMHDLTKDRGKVVLLDIWATWCEPCRRALPIYEQLIKQFGSRGLKVYAINVDEDSSEIPKFVKDTKLNLPVLVDRDGAQVEHKLGIRVMPTSFVLDKRGRVRHTHEGFSAESLSKYQSEIEALLSEKVE